MAPSCTWHCVEAPTCWLQTHETEALVCFIATWSRTQARHNQCAPMRHVKRHRVAQHLTRAGSAAKRRKKASRFHGPVTLRRPATPSLSSHPPSRPLNWCPRRWGCVLAARLLKYSLPRPTNERDEPFGHSLLPSAPLFFSPSPTSTYSAIDIPIIKLIFY